MKWVKCLQYAQYDFKKLKNWYIFCHFTKNHVQVRFSLTRTKLRAQARTKKNWRTKGSRTGAFLAFISDIHRILYVSVDHVDVRNDPPARWPSSTSKFFKKICAGLSSHFLYLFRKPHLYIQIVFETPGRIWTSFRFLREFYQQCNVTTVFSF